jgi:solute carrier family 45, member 1/2/4
MLTIILAVMSIYIADVCINAIQACCRAIIVDTLPSSKQEVGNGWAGRMVAIGHLIGYYLGSLDLVSIFNGALGATQLKSLCMISSFALLLTVGITCFSVQERVLTLPYGYEPGRRNIVALIRNTISTLRTTISTLPPRIKLLFKIQLCAWYGWFTFLFYSSTWVGEVYVKYNMSENDVGDHADRVGNIGGVGSMSLTVFSIMTLICSLILPEIVKSHSPSSIFGQIQRVIVNSTAYGRVCRFHLGLTELWLISHIIYSIANFLSGFCRSVQQATFIVALCGFSWAVTTWAPFALLAEEILLMTPPAASKEDTNENLDQDHEEEVIIVSSSRGSSRTNLSRPSSERESLVDEGDKYEQEPEQQEEEELEEEEEEEVSTTGEQAGIYVGIHNIAITTPQLVSTSVSFLIFSIFQKDPAGNAEDGTLADRPGQGDGGFAIALTMQIGSLVTLMGAYYTWKLINTSRTI